MPAATILITLSAFIVLALGAGHLALTYFTRAFHPRDAQLAISLRETSPRITAATTLWRGQIGFHASHSLGMIAFGAVYAYLALMQGATLLQSHFLLALGAMVLFSYVVLAKLYWFFLPLLGLGIAFVLYAAALLM